MSNYNATAVNPKTGNWETATILDNHFGRHRCGVRFGGHEKVYKESDIKFPDTNYT